MVSRKCLPALIEIIVINQTTRHIIFTMYSVHIVHYEQINVIYRAGYNGTRAHGKSNASSSSRRPIYCRVDRNAHRDPATAYHADSYINCIQTETKGKSFAFYFITMATNHIYLCIAMSCSNKMFAYLLVLCVCL